MISKFFHTPSTRKFNIKPRYYDPDKEERDQREERIKKELGIVDEKKETGMPYKPNVRGQFRNTDGWQKSSDEGRRAYQKRLLWLVFILALAFFLVFYSDIIF